MNNPNKPSTRLEQLKSRFLRHIVQDAPLEVQHEMTQAEISMLNSARESGMDDETFLDFLYNTRLLGLRPSADAIKEHLSIANQAHTKRVELERAFQLTPLPPTRTHSE